MRLSMCCVPHRIRRSPRHSLLPASSLVPPLLPSAIAGVSTSPACTLHASPRPQHDKLAGASNGEERNWILISGRPTAAPHSSYYMTNTSLITSSHFPSCGLHYCHRHCLHGELLVRGARPRLRGVLKSLPPTRVGLAVPRVGAECASLCRRSCARSHGGFCEL